MSRMGEGVLGIRGITEEDTEVVWGGGNAKDIRVCCSDSAQSF